MNYRFIVNQLGLLGLLLSAFLVAVAAGGAVALATRAGEGPASMAFLIAGAVAAVAGGAAWWSTRSCRKEFERREAILLVAASWVLGAVFAGLPYWLWGHLSGLDTEAAAALRRPVNCYFEAASGLTTTGSTILIGLDEMPRTILFWRGLTQWIGGLGIVVLFVAVLPSLGGGAKRLFLTETGSSREGVRPQIKETARLLLLIYLGLTVAQIAALKIAGMGWLDAFVHTFTSLASGGFSNYDASVGRFNNAAYDWIIILFMILGTVNFGLYYEAVRGRFRVILKDPEIRLYLIILASAGVLAWLLILPHPIVTTTGQEAAPGPLGTLRHALFNTVSVQTTTGYATVDFDRWPTLALGIIILVPFVGGCAGSTAGGIKVIRIWIAVKVLLAEIERAFRPNVVRPLRVGSAILDDSAKLSTLAYILGIVAIVLIGSAGLLVFERDKDVGFTTAFTATSACLFTTGPGLARVGPVTNYAWMSDLSKMWLTCVMFIGRLEVLTIIVLLSPRFWRESY